jgi:hypothetical protein
MRELDPIRRLAPPVEPLAPQDVARIRARALAPRRRRRNVGALLGPVAIAACVAAVVLVTAGGDVEVPAPTGQAPQGDVPGAPRLLLGGGWTVTRVDEWQSGSGEMTFERDGQELQLSWMPGRDAGPSKEDGARHVLTFGTADGARAAVWRWRGSDEYHAVWRVGDTSLDARGTASSAAAFAGMVENLRQVGVDEWLRALPASAVAPAERGDAVDEMLDGIPRPPGLDLARLRDSAATRDRYQLGAQVAGAVACGWIAEWAEARAAGDDERVRRATAALASSGDWAILREMNAEGDYPEAVWQYADAVAGDGTVMGGKRLTVEESYRAALCS